MKKIYESYFQKSKVFLYPLLNIPKGVRFVPSQTYLTWEDQFDLSRYKLIALYKINKLPSKILLSGKKGIGKSLLVKHSLL